MKRALALLVLVGCATPYQHMGFGGGYEERELTHGHWIVHVRVNGHTSADTAFEYLQRRALEICQQEGFSDYTIDNSQQSERTSAYRSGENIYVVQKPDVSASVRCESKPSI
jgi:hypothetical protein